jgi:hypothetical protein
MRFFEAIDLLTKTKAGFTVNGFDMIGNKFHIWSGPDWEKAKATAQDAKFSGRAWRVEILDPQGNPVPSAGGLFPRRNPI